MADTRTPGSSAYRAAGVDYEALDAGKRNALTEALATSGLLAAPGGRALDESRGEPAFVFEAGGQTLAFVVEGLGTKSIIARQVEEQLGVGALRQRRLRHGGGDRQRPLLRRRAAARGERVFRDRLLGVVRGRGAARRRCSPAGARRASTPAPSGAAGSRRPCPASSLPRTSSSPAAPSASSPEGRAPILGARPRARATRSCWSPAAACTPTAPRWRGWSPRGCPTATGPAPSGRVRRGAARPDRDLRGAGPGAARGAVDVHYLSHITGHGLLKLMRPRAS